MADIKIPFQKWFELTDALNATPEASLDILISKAKRLTEENRLHRGKLYKTHKQIVTTEWVKK